MRKLVLKLVPLGLFGASLVMAVASPDNQLQERKLGFFRLFEGTDLDSWVVDPDQSWVNEKGSMSGKAVPGLAETTYTEFQDYIVRFEWRSLAGGRAVLLPRGACSEMGLRFGDSPVGSGGHHPSGPAPSSNADLPLGDWNTTQVSVSSGTVTVVLNGKTVLDRSSFELAESGPLGFMLVAPPFEVRNLRLRPTGLDVAFFEAKVQPTFKLQCVGCHAEPSPAGEKMALQVPEMGSYVDSQVLSDYLAAASRVKPGDPESSLLMMKALGLVRHGGGSQFSKESQDYRDFVAWIKGAKLE